MNFQFLELLTQLKILRGGIKIENQENFRDVANVQLKPWQESLLEYVQQAGAELCQAQAS